MGGSENEWAGGAGEAAEAWEEAQETLGAFGAWEAVADGQAKEGPVWGPCGVSFAAAEVHLPLPVPLVGVTGSGGKAGGPLTAFDVEGEDILLSPPPDSNRFFFFFLKKNQQFIMQGSITVCGHQRQDIVQRVLQKKSYGSKYYR
jgi:hypothetical protein